MEKQPKLTRIGLTVVTIVILFVFVLFYASVPYLKRIAERSVCRNNLEMLGTAINVYSADYDGQYPVLPGNGPWSKQLGFDYYKATPDFSTGGREENVSRTITASWYLLVREADVLPKNFVCPGRDEQEFSAVNPQHKDLVKLWDFGEKPHDHVSYAYHNPYGKYSANINRVSSFAIAADMNPWFQNGNIIKSGPNGEPPQRPSSFSNSYSDWHDHRGLNVLYADGHAKFKRKANVGVKNDNIYTFWSTDENPSEQDIQGGTAPTGRSAENDAKSKDDSFLAI